MYRMARKWLKEAREKSGFSMKVLAKELNISESYYCEIENYNRQKRLDFTFAMKLSELLSVPIKTILDEESKIA